MLEKIFSLVVGLATLAAMPSSSSYKLNNYGFGSGGTANSTSATYGLNGTAGEQSSLEVTGSAYKAQPGNNYTQQAPVPPAPTFDNPNNYYNKLHFVVNPGPNASDAKFAIAISSDNFTTTQYVKSDNTVANTLALADYQTYATWGSATGSLVIGLTAQTTYTIKIKAMQGRFTESGYGPTASATTSPPQLSFSITTDTQPSAPFSINLGDLLAATVVDAPQQVNIAIDTNGEQGGNVYISGLNNGLKSTVAAYTISSATGDLTSLSEGFGAKVTATSQTSGGPLNSLAPYNGAGNNIGVTSAAIRQIMSSSSPIVGGTGSILLKAKSATLSPAATDYTDTLTMLAAASF